MSMEIDATDPQVTSAFYKRLYPFKQIYTWLNHNHEPTNLFTHREFAFTLIGDTYLRYHSFSKVDDLRNTVIRLNPTRFEIGAVYNARPKDKKTLRAGVLQPVLRELVFDIDMTDYDEIRTCCSGKDICKRCWAFISAAVEVLDPALRDQSALAMTDDERKAVLSFLEVIKGGKEMAKKVNVRSTFAGRPTPLHPSLAKAYDRLKGRFVEIVLEDQGCFDRQEGWETLLKLIPDAGKPLNIGFAHPPDADNGYLDTVSTLRAKWEDNPNKSSKRKWNDFVTLLHGDKQSVLTPAAEDIILQYTYPRLDAEVSKHRNHLLKAPFCIHPATGRICIPVDPAHVSEFDPGAVPTIQQLLEELGDVKAPEDGEHHADWERTSLKKYVDMLEKHTSAIMRDARDRRRAAAATAW
ncbi:hypothetical protein FRB99_008206 [Tulasnella sp. 403]|nr:hypothetical protein FRB99_008206 [Tulasnella sp. 403]